MRLLNIGLIALFIALQLTLWVGEGSIVHYLSLQSKISQQKAHIAELEARNQVLALDVYHLQNGYDAVEAYARSELGMIKSDETFYLVVND